MTLEPAWKENNSFNSAGKQVLWDSTSLGILKTCSRKYQLQIREGLASTEASPDLTWGILIHEASEKYHHARAEGKGHEESLRSALKHVFLNSYKPELIDGRDGKKSRSTLLRAVVWYLDQQEEDPLETVILENGKPATELSFTMPLPGAFTKEGDQYALCGHIDRLARLDAETYVVDIKSTKSTLSGHFFRKFNPGNQFSLYTVANRVYYGDQNAAGVIIDGVQCAKGFNRFMRDRSRRHEEQLEEWLQDTIWWIKMAERLVEERGDEPWPQNDLSCHLYRPCPFVPICTERPVHREAVKRTEYERKIWDCSISREV